MNNDNSMLWLLLLLFMMSNQPAVPTNEEICEKFQERVDAYLKENESMCIKARVGSPIWQLATLSKAAHDISDPDTRIQVLNVAMSILDNIEAANKYACGGIVNC